MADKKNSSSDDELQVPSDYKDPIIELYKKDVDRTLLRENLKLTVEQRIEKFEQFMLYVEELKRAGKKSRENKTK